MYFAWKQYASCKHSACSLVCKVLVQSPSQTTYYYLINWTSISLTQKNNFNYKTYNIISYLSGQDCLLQP